MSTGNDYMALMSVNDAQHALLKRFNQLEMEKVSLRNAIGRVLYKDIQSQIDLPIFPNSAMDGFAVRAEDIKLASIEKPIQLDVIVDIPAGEFVEVEIAVGQAARIMTGAPLPPGANTVVPVENTDFNFRTSGLQAPDTVKIFTPEAQGANVRPTGEDVLRGEKVLFSGLTLRSQDIGFLGMLGIGNIPVIRKPKVAILSCGDELLEVDNSLTPGKIFDANRHILMTLAEQLGTEVIDLGIVPDDLTAVHSSFESAVSLGVDLILSSAGVSVGAFDFIKEVVEMEGKLDFWRVNMRPGKPIAFGDYSGVNFIGLPGNPVSAFVGFQVFVLPAIRKMLGLDYGNRPKHKVKLTEPVYSDGRETYLRAVVSDDGNELVARLTGHQGSGNLRSLVQANALLILPSGVKSVPAGGYTEAWSISNCIEWDTNLW